MTSNKSRIKLRKFTPLKSIDFSEMRDGVPGFAKGWFFWVSRAFKSSLDITTNEYIVPSQTRKIRDLMSTKLFGLSHFELKSKIRASGEKLTENPDHLRIMEFAFKEFREVEAIPPNYSFRARDLLESKCGNWYIHVKAAREDATDQEGMVSFMLYQKNQLNRREEWVQKAFMETSQRDFVDLLRDGQNSRIALGEKTNL